MKILFVISIISFLPFLASACTCNGVDPFCETITAQSNVSTVRIIERFTPTDSTDLSTYFIVETIEDLIGTAPKDTMTVLAGFGSTCDPDIDNLERGDSLIVNTKEPSFMVGTIPYDFDLGLRCSTIFLPLENGKIHDGKSEDRTLRIDFSDFKKDIDNCSRLTNVDDPEFLDNMVILYPNPANDLLNVGFQFNTTSDYQIFDINGRLISENETANSVHEIDLSNLENGVYFIKIMVNEAFAIRKFVKL